MESGQEYIYIPVPKSELISDLVSTGYFTAIELAHYSYQELCDIVFDGVMP